MAYPDLTLFREGDDIAMAWFADPDTTTTNGRFIGNGKIRIDAAQAEAALTEFVSSVAERIRDLDDDDSSDFHATWNAIQVSRKEEPDLCKRLAMLGLDPYGDLDDRLLAQLEEIDLAPGVLYDLLAATKPETFADDIRSVRDLISRLPSLSDSHSTNAPIHRTTEVLPYKAGYARAATVRKELGLPHDQPVQDIIELTSTLFNHAPVEEWLADEHCPRFEAALQKNGTTALVAPGRHETTMRFVRARALHHWLYLTTAHTHQRLLTTGKDWQQAASRAFAAEILAPAAALATRLEQGDDWEREEELAAEFNVSPRLIAHQISNHDL